MPHTLHKFKVVVIGAGLGGLGAAIAISLGGHSVTVLEGASEIGEIGAGIQILPNATRILKRWGLEAQLSQYWTTPRCVNMLSWKGHLLSSLDFSSAAKLHGEPFWDFHRANLHRCLLDRAAALGAEVRCDARVDDLEFSEDACTAVLSTGERVCADLIIGADGIHSKTRECMLGGRKDPPTPTGDLAYRLLLNTEEMLKTPELREMVEDPQVNYWMGPDAHAVTYVLRGGKQFNMVLLVPDDIPEDGAMTVAGSISDAQRVYNDWDPRISKLLKLCDNVYKWKLCIRHDNLENWYHPSRTFVLLGDSVHATLPYLASGAGMALEDGAVLGQLLSFTHSKSDLPLVLQAYQTCRRQRVARVVERSNLQQHLYHLHDGPEQEERDKRLQEVPTRPGEVLGWRDPELAPWLLQYDAYQDAEKHWAAVMAGRVQGSP